MDYRNLTELEKNQLVHQYEKLINRIINQFHRKGYTSWDQLESMALEGFALAIHNYDSTRSTLTFTQFAAYAIRNNILTSLDNELRVVKLSAYAQKKVTETGGTTWNTVRLETSSGSDDSNHEPIQREVKLGAYTKAKFDDGDVFEYLYSRIEDEFSERDSNMFYMCFGLKEFDVTPGKTIAQMYGVSEGLVSQRIKRITRWIKQDNDLCEMLANLIS